MPRMSVFTRYLLVALALTAPLPTWDALAAQPATPMPFATPVAPGATQYVDPAGRFTVPIPTGWTAATVGEAGVLTSPEGGITVYALTIPGTEIPKALDEAWRKVDPAFDLIPGEPLDIPATAGLRPFTVVAYEGGPADEAVQAVAQVADDTIFVILVRADLDEAARRASQMQTAALGLQITGVEVISLQGIAPRTLTPAMLSEVDAFVETTMERFGIPGAAYAVVQDDRIVHAEGFGVRAAGSTDSVTSETLMMVGSVTKPMTTTYMATIVDDRKMCWDEPVVAILPSFVVADPEVTPQLTASVLPFGEAVPNRVFELAFDQPAEGDASIEFVVEQQRQAFAEPEKMLVPLDESVVTPFRGTWEHPALGEVTLEFVDGRLILDAEEFASEIVATRDEETGETFYLTSTPPLGGLRISLRDDAGTRSLVVHDPASTDLYPFRPVAGVGATPLATPVGF